MGLKAKVGIMIQNYPTIHISKIDRPSCNPPFSLEMYILKPISPNRDRDHIYTLTLIYTLILILAPVSYTHLTLPTIYSV